MSKVIWAWELSSVSRSSASLGPLTDPGTEFCPPGSAAVKDLAGLSASWPVQKPRVPQERGAQRPGPPRTQQWFLEFEVQKGRQERVHVCVCVIYTNAESFLMSTSLQVFASRTELDVIIYNHTVDALSVDPRPLYTKLQNQAKK